jgi:hypothetical protein
MKGIDGRGGRGDMPDFTHGKKKLFSYLAQLEETSID